MNSVWRHFKVLIQLILAKKCREQPLESKTNLGADLIGFGLPLLETLFLFEGKWLADLSHFQFFWIEINDLVDLCLRFVVRFWPRSHLDCLIGLGRELGQVLLRTQN